MQFTHLTDQELVQLLQQGDKKAFDALYGRYWRKLYLLPEAAQPGNGRRTGAGPFHQLVDEAGKFADHLLGGGLPGNGRALHGHQIFSEGTGAPSVRTKGRPPTRLRQHHGRRSLLPRLAGGQGGLIQEYEAGDLRKEVTFQRTLGSNTQQRWLTWKHHVLGTGATGQANFPVYRLAEMYLINAEASNELGLLDPTGLDYINQLRRRAFGLPLTTSSERDIPGGLSQAQYRDIIRSERRKELAIGGAGGSRADILIEPNSCYSIWTAGFQTLPSSGITLPFHAFNICYHANRWSNPLVQ